MTKPHENTSRTTMSRFRTIFAVLSLAVLFVSGYVLQTIIYSAAAPDFSLNRVELLRFDLNHPDANSELLMRLESAKSEILLDLYAIGGRKGRLQAEGIGLRLLGILKQKQREGVTVRLITHRYSEPAATVGLNRSSLNTLQPLYDEFVSAGLQVVQPFIDGPTKIDHDKMIVIDGTTVITGSRNFAESTSRNVDLNFAVTGAAATEARDYFYYHWSLVTFSQLQEPRRSLAFARQASHEILKLLGLKTGSFSKPRFVTYLSQVISPVSPRQEIAGFDDRYLSRPSIESRQSKEGAARCDVRFDGAGFNLPRLKPVILDFLRPLAQNEHLDIALLTLMDPDVIYSLGKLNVSSERLRVLLDPRRNIYGVKCNGGSNLIALTRLNRRQIDARFYAAADEQEYHVKMAMRRSPSGSTILSGSANWAPRSLTENWESVLTIQNCPSAESELLQLFETDWLKHSAVAAQLTDDEVMSEVSKCASLIDTESWAGTRLRTDVPLPDQLKRSTEVSGHKTE